MRRLTRRQWGVIVAIAVAVVALWRAVVLLTPDPPPVLATAIATHEPLLIEDLPRDDSVGQITPQSREPEPAQPKEAPGGGVELFKLLKRQHLLLPVNPTRRLDVPTKADVVGDLGSAAVQITSTLLKSDNINQLTDLVDDAAIYPGSVLRARSLVDQGSAVPFTLLPLNKITVSLGGIKMDFGAGSEPITATLDNTASSYNAWISQVSAKARCVPTIQLRYFVCYSAEDFRFEMESSVKSPWVNVEAAFKKQSHRESCYLCVVYTEKHFRVAVNPRSPEQWFATQSIDSALMDRAAQELVPEDDQRHLTGNPLAYVSQLDYGKVLVWVSEVCRATDLMTQGLGIDSGPVDVTQSMLASKELRSMSGILFTTGAVKAESAGVAAAESPAAGKEASSSRVTADRIDWAQEARRCADTC